MKKIRWHRLLGMALAVSLTAAGPAYGSIPVITPFPSQTQGPGQAVSPDETSVAGPGEEGGPGVNQGAPKENCETAVTVQQPEILSQGAVLLDASSGKILFEKNGDTRFYPASITKLMTALLVAERCSLDETVTFSKTATTNLESGAVTLGLVEGDQLSVKDCLYGLLLKSANEVANGLAEHVSGSVEAFASLMNQRARELGCTGTNFVNPNGLNNSNHYTTARDMAFIAKAAFDNEIVRQVASTLTYQIPATKNAAARTVTMGHKMINPADSRYYEGVIGGKTGYTSLAGNTLVTCAEKNGKRLIAVIMKSSSSHYADTKALLDYGFALGQNESGARWQQENGNWYFLKASGSKAVNQWMNIDSKIYWFDSEGVMLSGWKQINGSWYYFHSTGDLAVNCWVDNGENWYYVGADGVMLTNGMTPDGYQVGSDGAWIRA